MFLTSVKRWRPMVSAELARQSVPLPTELILAVLQRESNGVPGTVNQKSGASGLLQVMPGTLKDFNKREKKKYTLSDMRSSDLSSAQKQIEVGISTLASFWRSAYRYLSDRLPNVPIDELSRIADLFYAAGPGAVQKRLDPISPTWNAVQAHYPNWNALPHPRHVFELVDSENTQWNLPAISAWLDTGAGAITTLKKPAQGFAVGLLIILAAYVFMKRGK